jgi:hypothetical protein
LYTLDNSIVTHKNTNRNFKDANQSDGQKLKATEHTFLIKSVINLSISAWGFSSSALRGKT